MRATAATRNPIQTVIHWKAFTRVRTPQARRRNKCADSRPSRQRTLTRTPNGRPCALPVVGQSLEGPQRSQVEPFFSVLRGHFTVRQHERSERAHCRERPPAPLHSTDDVLLRDESPVAAVRAVVPVIAHYEVVPLRNNLRSPIVVAAILGDHERIAHRDVIDVNAAVDDANRSPSSAMTRLTKLLSGFSGKKSITISPRLGS